MDGWIKIGTKLDNSQINKDIKSLTTQLNKLQKEEEKLNNKKIKLDLDISEYEKKVQEIKNSTNKELENAETDLQVNTVLEIEESQIAKIKSEYSEQFSEIEKINSSLNENKVLQDQIGNEISENNSKLKTTNTNSSEIFSDASSGITNTIKKVAKLSLAVLGVRTAYNFVRSAASTLATYNDQLSDDLEYITYSVATALESVITKIVSLVYTALQYVNYLAMAWFGVNLFANATTDSLNSSNEAADELNETLASFDDLQVLSDDSSSSSSSDTVSPSVDLSSMEDVEIPDWLTTLGENLDIVILALGTLLSIQVGVWIAGIVSALAPFTPFLLVLAGIVLVVVGLAVLLYGIIEFIQDPTWENFATILIGIALIVAGIAILFASWPLAIVAVLILIVALVIKYWDEICDFFSSIGSWFSENVIEPIATLFTNLWQGVKDGFFSAIDWIKEKFSDLKTWFSEKISALGDIFSNLWDGFKNGASDAWEGIKNIFSNVADFFKNIFSEAWEGVKSVFSTGGEIFSGITDGILSSFKSIVNTLIDGINTVVAIPFNGINTALTKLKGIEILGVSPFSWLSTISVPEIPKLATGGIIDVPGTGVTATIGEAGKEAVLPLENNTEWMDTLADKIANNSSMELTINVIYEDGKKIIKKINNANTKAGKQLLEI